MLPLSLTICAVCLIVYVVQALPILGFARVLENFGRPRVADADCPKVAVILCLRGGDPFLPHCLEGLFRQDFPGFQTFVIVDSPEDPAYQVVQDWIRRSGAANVVVEVLKERLTTCSLKGSSIAQAMSHVDESFAVVAMLDSDVIPHPTWLRELVAPFADATVGVASGTRWYMPTRPDWGALIRYYWNAAATVQMYLNDITWGGSVALRSEVARHPDMIASWTTAVSTDTVILRVVRNHGLRAEFVPSLIMVNRETCTFPSFFQWVQRQMVVVRLYHRAWAPVVTFGLFQALLITTAWIFVGVSATSGQRLPVAILLTTIFSFWLGFGLLFTRLESRVRNIVRSRGEPLERFEPNRTLRGYLAMFATQFVYGAVLIKVCFIRQVSWRGVRYQVNGPHDVQLLSYEPFTASDRTNPAESL